MKSMKTLLTILLIAMTFPASAHPAPMKKKPVIQLAILLDTSNSMDGLIDQARTQLWRVVNEFGRARKGGVMPELQVALYEYGNSSLREKDGYIRRVHPFTTDLDRVSEELFALRTNGGDEYCGQVIREAVRGLDWSASGNDLRVIFIAGNEPFTQGSVDFKASCAMANTRGIIVNTIFCGDRHEGLQTHWGTGALLAEGSFVAIDQNAKAIHMAAPQDDEIANLGMQLNTTYTPTARRERKACNASPRKTKTSSNRREQTSSGSWPRHPRTTRTPPGTSSTQRKQAKSTSTKSRRRTSRRKCRK